MKRRANQAVVCMLVVVVGASSAWAQLDPNQQRLLTEAKSHLTQLQTNLKLAQDSAGPTGSTPTAARGRLALTRLDSTAQPIANIDARLALLPADDEAVKTFQKDYAAAKESVTQLRTRLTTPASAAPQAPSASPSAPANAPAAAPAGAPRLDYRQEQNLRDALFTIREVQGRADALSQVVEKIKPIADPNTIDHRLMVTAMNTIEDARRKAGQAQERFPALPPDGPGVADAKQQLASAVASVDASEAVIRPIHERLLKVVDPAAYPSMATDIARLRDLAAQYGNTDLFQSNRPLVAELIKAEPAAKQELARVQQAYAVFIAQQTEASKQVEGSARYLTEKLQAFDALAAQSKAKLPGEIDTDLAAVQKMADDAVAGQRHAYFSGGIPQQMGFVEEKVVLYEAIDPAAATAYRQKLGQTQQAMKQREASLKDAIIASTPLPPDRYTGSDKQAMIALATEKWKADQPSAQVLAVRIPSQGWERESMWRLQNTTWYKIDRSRLQAQVIVKVDDKIAVIRPINLWKDHLQNDRLSATSLHTPTEEVPPGLYLLLDKVR